MTWGGVDTTWDDVLEEVKKRFTVLDTHLKEIKMEKEGLGTVAQDRFTLDEGPIVLTYPVDIGLDGVVEFEDWIRLVLGRIRRRATDSLPTKGDQSC